MVYALHLQSRVLSPFAFRARLWILYTCTFHDPSLPSYIVLGIYPLLHHCSLKIAASLRTLSSARNASAFTTFNTQYAIAYNASHLIVCSLNSPCAPSTAYASLPRYALH